MKGGGRVETGLIIGLQSSVNSSEPSVSENV